MKKTIVLLLFTIHYSLFAFLCSAQYSVLYNMKGPTGANPCSTLVVSGKMLYSTTDEGGFYGDGCIFSYNTGNQMYADLFDFNGAIGEQPTSLILVGKRLFGTTCIGGSGAEGTVFAIDTDGSNFSTLVNFNGSNGANPGSGYSVPGSGSLLFLNKKLYGMASYGGANGDGAIYSVDTNGSNFTDLFDFEDTTGIVPFGSLIASGTTLYGMTYYGGEGANDDGVVFSIQTNGSGYTTLLNFNIFNGDNPNGALVLSGNVLYGMTYDGGVNGDGNIFSIHTNGSGYTDMFDFNAINGDSPSGSLILSGTTLYGMTYFGGLNYDGLVFSIKTNGSGYSDMFDFNGTNGENPAGDLVLSGTTLYGVTEWGGADNDGVIFEIDTNTTNSVHQLSEVSGQWSVYPNPSAGIFNIQLSVVSGQWSVEVYNVLGEKVYTSPVTHHASLIVDLRSKSNGVYFYRVASPDGKEIGCGKLILDK